MRLPDPFTRDLKIDLLPETYKQPEVHSDFMYNLMKRPEFLSQIQTHLKTGTSIFDKNGGASFIKNFLLEVIITFHLLTALFFIWEYLPSTNKRSRNKVEIVLQKMTVKSWSSLKESSWNWTRKVRALCT
jgi:hypothetical protein